MATSPLAQASSRVVTTSAIESAVLQCRRKPVCCSARNCSCAAIHSSHARAIVSITLQAAEVSETGLQEMIEVAGFRGQMSDRTPVLQMELYCSRSRSRCCLARLRSIWLAMTSAPGAPRRRVCASVASSSWNWMVSLHILEICSAIHAGWGQVGGGACGSSWQGQRRWDWGPVCKAVGQAFYQHFNADAQQDRHQ